MIYVIKLIIDTKEPSPLSIEVLDGVSKGREICEQTCRAHGLTFREIQIARLVAKGATYKEIGGELHISPKTVGRHLANIYLKLKVSGKANLLGKLYGG